MDDKQALSASRVGSRQQRRRHFAAGVLSAALLLTCWTLRSVAGPGRLLSWISGPAGADASFPEVYTDWDDIPVSDTLNWAPCFPFHGARFLCARLSVPMDYSRVLDESKVHIAMVMLVGPGHGRLPRRFSESPLLVNPGGPGGQGTEFVLSAGAALQAIAGGRDVIGFDPRGIGATVPQADCFRPAGTGNSANEPGSTSYAERNRALMHRYTFQIMAHDTGLPNSTSDAMAKYAIKVKSLAQMCEKRVADGEKIFKFMGTPDVARDMKTIVAAWDDWMSTNSYVAEAPAVSSSANGLTVPIPSTKGKLVYWGFSYGTLLGATFAAMFPDMVGRLVLDGVMDADYYERPVLGKAMRDADKVLASFFGYCHEANTRCALYRKDDSIADIQARFEGVMSRLQEEPLIFVPKDSGVPFTITASDIKGVVFQSLYFPVSSFPKLAEIIDSIYRGGDLEPVLLKPDLTPMCLPDFKLRVYPEDSGFSTSCSDRQYEVNETIAGLQQSFEQVSKITSFADIWSALTTGCSYWKVDRERPQGEEWHNRLLHHQKPIDTSHPIMFIGNTHDPVTPLFQALKMSQRFRNAGLVELEAAGHCTMAATSFCAVRKIQDYFVRGIAPPPPKLEASISDDESPTGQWTKCQPNQYPWKPVGRFGDVESAVEELSEEQMNLADAWSDIASSLKNWVTPRGPLA